MSILSKLLGTKYYVVVARGRFSLHEFIVGHIFKTRNDAKEFCNDLAITTRTDVGLEIHSIRSHLHLDTYEKENA